MLKLPRICIPTFTGTYTQWLKFHDLFDSIVIKNTTLNDAQRLYYLKSCLSDEALIIVKNQSATVDNYESILTALNDRYDNNKSLINEYLKLFYELPKITSDFLINFKKHA